MARPARAGALETPRPRSRRLRERLRRDTSPPATGAFAERLSERTRAERRLRSRTVLIVLACVAGLVALGWALLVSPLLALDPEQVAVTGTGEDTTVPTGDVLALVEQHAGTPLPRLDLEDLRGQVAALPTVFGAEVHRSWPRGLVVDVVPRTPVAAIETDGRVELLDVEGVTVDVLDEVPEGMARVDVPRSGERAPQTLAAVLAVLAELPEPIHAQVAVATAGGPASITLELTDGAEVRWGGPDESALKAAVLEVLREQPAAVYDVTVPRSPTTSD